MLICDNQYIFPTALICDNQYHLFAIPLHFSALNTLKMPHIYLTFQIQCVCLNKCGHKVKRSQYHVFGHRDQIVARELLVQQYIWHDVILNDFRCLYVSFVRTLTTYFKDTSFFGRPHTEVYRVIWSLVITSFSKLEIKTVYFSSLSRAYFQNYTQKHLWGKQGWFGLRLDWQYHQRGNNVMWRKSSNGVLPG